MRLEFYGVRGTFPGQGRAGTKIGVNTPCARITTRSGETIIVDAGTGLRPLGNDLTAMRKTKAPLKVSLLLTHFHLDHIFGLPFYGPLYLSGTAIDVYSWREPEDTREILSRLSAAPLFPVPIETTPSKMAFTRIGEDGAVIGGARVTFCPLMHPQGCVAFRVEEDGKSIVFATDTEHPAEGLDERLAAFARGASVFIYDAMYLPQEYLSGRQGWGPSTWEQGVRLARAAGVSRLVLSHFNPDHDDQAIRKMRRAAARQFHKTSAAAEGMKIKL
ncbi:MAG: MBL fold metallo-hydrolase [Candidatus Aminicenantales bacterium]|jgi:phosphoribosyl 1,2-cyclic phosphodiesterase